MGIVDDLRQNAVDTLEVLRVKRDELKAETERNQQDISDLILFINAAPVQVEVTAPMPARVSSPHETAVSLSEVRDWAQQQSVPFMVKDCARAFDTTDAIVRIHFERLVSMGTIRSTDPSRTRWVYYQFVKPRLQMAS